MTCTTSFICSNLGIFRNASAVEFIQHPQELDRLERILIHSLWCMGDRTLIPAKMLRPVLAAYTVSVEATIICCKRSSTCCAHLTLHKQGIDAHRYGIMDEIYNESHQMRTRIYIVFQHMYRWRRIVLTCRFSPSEHRDSFGEGIFRQNTNNAETIQRFDFFTLPLRSLLGWFHGFSLWMRSLCSLSFKRGDWCSLVPRETLVEFLAQPRPSIYQMSTLAGKSSSASGRSYQPP